MQMLLYKTQGVTTCVDDCGNDVNHSPVPSEHWEILKQRVLLCSSPPSSKHQMREYCLGEWSDRVQENLCERVLEADLYADSGPTPH